MNCDDIKNNLYAYIDGELNKEDSAKLDAHIHSCAKCTQEIKNEQGEYIAAENVVSVNTAVELAEALLNTIEGTTTGQVDTNQASLGQVDYGADANGSILSIEVDGTIYTKTHESVEDNLLSITTEGGADFSFNFETEYFKCHNYFLLSLTYCA